jgi:hypothetical protein
MIHLINAFVKRFGLNVILVGRIFDALNLNRRIARHREVGIADTGPIDRSTIGELRSVIRSVGKRVISLVPLYVAVDSSNCFGFDLIKTVMTDRVIANAGADRKTLC